MGTVTLGAAGASTAAGQQSDACDDVDYVYAIVPEAEEDVAELVDDPDENERYCTVEEQLAGVLGVEEGDQIRLWNRNQNAAAVSAESEFTVASVTDDRLARIRANESDLTPVGIDPRGVGKVSADASAQCFDEESTPASDV